MFTLEQITEAHSKVKSGADFPEYIRTLKKLGITNYITFVADGHSEYFGDSGHGIKSQPKYSILNVADENQNNLFKEYLKSHQQGQSDYLTFSRQAAETGIEKWIVSVVEMTCTYYDKAGNKILAEKVPE